MTTLPTQIAFDSRRGSPGPGGLVVPSPGQLRLKDTLLMAAAYNAGEDIRSAAGAAPSFSPLLTPTTTTTANNNNDNNNNNKDQHYYQNNNNDISSSDARGPTAPINTTAVDPPTSGVDRNPSLLDLNDDDQKLRTTCDGCTISKIKCDGGHPCKRCQRRRSECVYREKKRCGPKRRKSSRDDSEDDSDTGGGPVTSVGGDGSSQGHGHVGQKVLTDMEQQFLAKFFASVNKFIPMTCATVIRDAMNPLPLDIVAGISASEEEKNVYHARKAVLLGCVAVGAVFCGDEGSAGAYMAQAQIHLKDCFDALLSEVVSCYLIMVVYHLHFLDRSKVFRYIGFAQQAYRELVQSKQALDGYVTDSVRMLSTFLHVACNNNIHVEEIDLRVESSPEPGSSSLSRIIAVFSHVLLMLYRKTDPEAAAKAMPQKSLPTIASLAAMANEADLLLSMVEEPGSFALIVMKTLRGYFLLMNGKDKEVLESVALPVAKALEADHGVLHFPLCWHMCQCVSAFLRRKGVHAVAEDMDQFMDPLRQSLAYASSCCGVALKVFSVYAGQGTVAPLNGLFSTAAKRSSSKSRSSSVPEERYHDRSDPADCVPSSSSHSSSAASSGAAAAAAAAAEVSSVSRQAEGTDSSRHPRPQQNENFGERNPKRRAPGVTTAAAAAAAAATASASASGGNRTTQRSAPLGGGWGVATDGERGASGSGRAGPAAGAAVAAAGADGIFLDSPVFGAKVSAPATSTAAAAAAAASAAAAAVAALSTRAESSSSLSTAQQQQHQQQQHMGFYEVGAAQRQHVAFELVGGRRDPFSEFSLRPDFGGGGEGLRAGSGGSGGGGGGVATMEADGVAVEGGRGGGGLQQAESVGSSPIDARLSSETTPPRVEGNGDCGDADSGLITHILEGL